jgi:hypothetical protein
MNNARKPIASTQIGHDKGPTGPHSLDVGFHFWQ